MSISKRNSIIYLICQFTFSFLFTAPIWYVFYLLRNVTEAEISIIVTVQYLSQMAWELPSGALADILGRKNILLIAFFLSFVAYFLMPFVWGFIPFLLLSIISSIGDSFRSGSEEALIYDSYLEDNREKDIDKIYLYSNNIYQVGLILGAIFGGYMYIQNPSYPFFGYALSVFIGFIAILFYKEPKIDSVKFTIKNYLLQIKEGTKEIFKNNEVRLYSLFYIIVGGIAWSSTLYFNEVLMVDLGINDIQRGVFSGVMRFVNILIITFILKRSGLFDRSRTIIFFILATLIAYLPGVFLKGFEGLIFIQIAMIITTARWVILSPIVNKHFSSKYRATAISSLSLFIGFIYILCTGISIYIIPTFGMKIMYSLLGVVSLLTVLPIGFVLLKHSNQSINEKDSI